jgi:hypothetical protein
MRENIPKALGGNNTSDLRRCHRIFFFTFQIIGYWVINLLDNFGRSTMFGRMWHWINDLIMECFSDPKPEQKIEQKEIKFCKDCEDSYSLYDRNPNYDEFLRCRSPQNNTIEQPSMSLVTGVMGEDSDSGIVYCSVLRTARGGRYCDKDGKWWRPKKSTSQPEKDTPCGTA